MKKITVTVFVLLLTTVAFYAIKGSGGFSISKKAAVSQFKDGDLIFQSSTSGQSLAISLATKSKYTHCGIIFIENGEPIVYHAVQPVKKSRLTDFIAMGTDGEYWVRRLKGRDSILSKPEIAKMKTEASSMIGKDYDIYFNWGDDQIYCSEYIWKIYKRGANVEIGPLKPMKEFDLSNKIVKDIMAKRYGSKIPLEEKMIAPGDICDNTIFENVSH